MTKAALILAALVAALGAASPASATPGDRVTWDVNPPSQSACVEDHSGRAANVRYAIRAWNRLGAHLHQARDCGDGRVSRHVIVIHPTYYRRSRVVGKWRTTRYWLDDHTAARGYVALNRYEPKPHRAACVRQWVMVHEIGHALGLAHTHARSVMNDADWLHCGHVTAADRRMLHASARRYG